MSIVHVCLFNEQDDDMKPTSLHMEPQRVILSIQLLLARFQKFCVTGRFSERKYGKWNNPSFTEFYSLRCLCGVLTKSIMKVT